MQEVKNEHIDTVYLNPVGVTTCKKTSLLAGLLRSRGRKKNLTLYIQQTRTES